MDIRAATLDDLDALEALDRACFARAWTREQWLAELEPSGLVHGLVLITRDGERPIAYASAPMLAERCELRRIGVLAEARGHMLGGDLIHRVIDHAKREGCTRIELEVAANNLAAIALYQRTGFRTVGVRPRYYLDPPADAWMMDLVLATRVWTSRAGSPM